MTFLFQLGIALGTLRMVWVATFAVIHARREKKRWNLAWTPQVVRGRRSRAQRGEGRSASRSARCWPRELCQLQDHRRRRRIERSHRRCRARTFAGKPRVEVLSKSNGGKWSALNAALQHTDAEIVVTLDADTMFEPDALPMLLRHFADPRSRPWRAAPALAIASTCSRASRRSSTSPTRTSTAARSSSSTASPWCRARSAPGGVRLCCRSAVSCRHAGRGRRRHHQARAWPAGRSCTSRARSRAPRRPKPSRAS